ncbi:MAG: class I SAM-dependent methyltransferase [Planctomycetota bacterium]
MKADLVGSQRAHPLLEEDLSHYWSSPFGQLRRQRRMEIFAGKLSACRRILEIGCGAGEFSAAFPSSSSMLVSCDLIPHMARAAVRTGRGQEGRVLVLDAHRLSFPDASFDGAFGNAVLHHLDPLPALREIRRVLKPGSPLVFSEPNMSNPMVWLIKNVGFIGTMARETPGETAFRRNQLESLAQEAGFRNVEVRHYDFCIGPAPLLPLIRLMEPALEAGFMRSWSLSLLLTAKA